MSDKKHLIKKLAFKRQSLWQRLEYLFKQFATDEKHLTSHLKNIQMTRREILAVSAQLVALGALAPNKAQGQFVPFSFWNKKDAPAPPSGAPGEPGALYAWGRLPRQFVFAPTELPGNWTKIAFSGFYHSAGIRTDNTLWTWGMNNSGQMAQAGPSHSPVQVPGTTWTDVATGFTHTGALRSDGTLWMWGSNGSGQLGQNNVTPQSSPVQVPGSWSQIVLGGESSFGIRPDSTLWSWGLNATDQLGVMSTTAAFSSPVQVPGSWLQVSSNGQTTLGIKTDYTLWGWGDAQYGLLGQGDTIDSSSPVQILGSWSQVSLRFGTAGGLHTDGTLWVWGNNSYGALGTGNTTSYQSPVQVAGSWSQIVMGGEISGGFKSDGSLWMWGAQGPGGPPPSSKYGDAPSPLGIDGVPYSVSPVQKTGAWTDLFINNYQMGAISAAGTTSVWGQDKYGQLGCNEWPIWSNDPVNIVEGSWVQFQSFMGIQLLGLKDDNTLWTVGVFEDHQLTGSWNQAVFGDQTQARIDTDGHLLMSGWNSNGNLGSDSTKYYGFDSPFQHAGSWSQVALGGEHTMAIRTDGTLWTWGMNNYGQLGQGNITGYSSPVQVPGSWSQIATNTNSSFALKSDNTLWAWGDNSSGNLGTGNSTNYSSPVQIPGTWQKLFQSNALLGGTSAGAIRPDGTLWVWGTNKYGNLGTNNTTYYNSPVQLPGSWAQIAFSGPGSGGVKSDGTGWTWGSSLMSGYFPVTNSSPVQVAGSWIQINGGEGGSGIKKE